jgi:hypothetical protein
MIYLKYLRTLLLHKWYVFLAGLKVGGIPIWRLIVHDWSKFMPVEFGPYARYTPYFGNEKAPKHVQLAFDYAWLHHQNVNPHHWQYWILVYDDEAKSVYLPMPETYCREMVADWMGASMAYTGSWDMSEWLAKQFPEIAKKMHSDSIKTVTSILKEQGYKELTALYCVN